VAGGVVKTAAAARPAAGRGAPGELAEVARGGTLNLAGALVAAIATLGTTLVVTRMFSKVEAGAFFTATSAFLIVESLGGLGASTGLVYFIARLRSLGEKRRIPLILRSAVIPVIVTSLILTVAMLALAGPLAHLLLSGRHARGVNPGAVTAALRGLALAVPFAALVDTFLGATRGYREMRPTVMIDRIGTSVAQLIAVAVAAAAGSVALLAPLWALPYVPAAAASWLWLRRVGRHPDVRRPALPDVPPELAALMALARPAGTADGRTAHGAGDTAGAGSAAGRVARKRLANANPRGFWRFTVPRAVSSLVSIMMQRLDIVLVAIMRGPALAAVYTAATRFLVLGQSGNTAVSRAAQPRFAELFAVDDRRGANLVYQATTAWLILLTWPLYLLAVAFAPLVLSLFGHSYSAGYSVMVVLGVALLASAATGQVDVVLITAGRSTWSLANGLLVLTTNVALDVALIPRYGILGAAIAWAIAITVSNLVPLAQLAVVYRLHPFGRPTLAACVLAGVSFGVVPFVIRAVLGGGWASLAAGAATGSVLYAAGLLRFSRALRLQGMPGMTAMKARLRRLIGSSARTQQPEGGAF
jgi:O-antigen/teichoic acid export membrane protein